MVWEYCNSAEYTLGALRQKLVFTLRLGQGRLDGIWSSLIIPEETDEGLRTEIEIIWVAGNEGRCHSVLHCPFSHLLHGFQMTNFIHKTCARPLVEDLTCSTRHHCFGNKGCQVHYSTSEIHNSSVKVSLCPLKIRVLITANSFYTVNTTISGY